MKLNEQQQLDIIEKSPNQYFDICSKCAGVELFGNMQELNEVDFDLICNDCKKNIIQ
jgi:hypothetical protein|tara:strand:+ start:834 stop:1004 length:171 start_codon:yes stop_codon:yes gene_type:complete